MSSNLQDYWKTVVDTMMEGVVVVDQEGSILSVNKALERITGYTARELKGRECAILDCNTCFSVDEQGKRKKKCALFRTGSVVRRRCQLRRKDGRPLDLLKNATVLRDSNGTIVGGVETLTDITDLVAKERTINELKCLLSSGEEFEGIIGRSSRMLDVYALIRNAAASDAPIIIYGESGTGKEIVANAIHMLGRRNKGPFIKVSCAALNESLLESELFGHVKGAFTGADKDRRGRFEASHLGDLFLDEIGDIPLSTQIKLLRVLQEKEVERVGDQTPITIDTRIIAATHRDLEQMCRERRFREDLYYRLNVIPIHLPALRDRKGDIPLLVDHFMKAIRLRTEKHINGVTEEALERLAAHRWPGNVRELVNVLEYAFVVCHDELIAPHHLPPLTGPEKPFVPLKKENGSDEEQRERIIKVLEEAGGNRQKAAQTLGISRVTLWKLLKRFNLKPELHFKT
ncbi:MAG: modulated sigma54 specific transcriptional regulator, Fis family [Deltaproteobacteria bacterium]|jgi:PAS domain S-box-containing protein|nr:modulated sigma54 specific transcriptional regulator, Fis family [Deltaproteobacteria bacterium]